MRDCITKKNYVDDADPKSKRVFHVISKLDGCPHNINHSEKANSKLNFG